MRNRMIRLAMLAVCGLSLGSAVLKAQDATAPAPPAGQEHGRPDPAKMEARHLDMMTRHLKLTPDQVTQVKAIEDGQMTEMAALREDTSTPRQDKRAKMLAMRQDSQTKIRAVLTDEQKPKFDEMVAMEKERMGHPGYHPGGQDGAAPPPPPAQ